MITYPVAKITFVLAEITLKGAVTGFFNAISRHKCFDGLSLSLVTAYMASLAADIALRELLL